jgi:hypothetical protein
VQQRKWRPKQSPTTPVSQIDFALSFHSYTFAADYGFRPSMAGIKREVRCKSGAIPVAVRLVKCNSTFHLLILQATFHSLWEGRPASTKPEDLPRSQTQFQLSGEKQQMYVCQHLIFFWKQSLKNFSFV